MSFKIPDNNKKLKIIPAYDAIEDLISIYNKVYKTINGKTISDIAQVYEKLDDWETIERVDLIIPYTYAHKRNEPMGHRIWYLSQPKRNQFYYGSFFDIQVSQTPQVRCIRKKCKLSKSAIKFFLTHKEVVKNAKIEI